MTSCGGAFSPKRARTGSPTTWIVSDAQQVEQEQRPQDHGDELDESSGYVTPHADSLSVTVHTTRVRGPSLGPAPAQVACRSYLRRLITG